MIRVKKAGRQRLSFRNASSSKSWSYRLFKEQIYRRLLAERYIFGIFDSLEELRHACIDMCIYTGKLYEFNYRAIQYWLLCASASESRAVKKLSKEEIKIIAKVCGISGKSIELFSSIWLSPRKRGEGRFWICVDGPEKLKFAKIRDYIRSDLKGVKSLPEGYEAYLINLQEVGIDENSKKAAE